MTLDELIAWVSEQAARSVRAANRWESQDDVSAPPGIADLVVAEFCEEAATLTSVENALRRLAQIERDHGGEA